MSNQFKTSTAATTAAHWHAFTTRNNRFYAKHTAKYGKCGSWGSIG